jgi:Cytosol aminopeptidase family, catalytic domain
MPGPSATKPGDMWVLFSTLGFKELMALDSIYTMSGKSVEVDNTDSEGRLVLSGMIPFSNIL